MKKYLNYAVWTMMIVFTMSVVSCGDDDDPVEDMTTSEWDSKIHGGWNRTYTELGQTKTESLVFVLNDHSGMRTVEPGNYSETYYFNWSIKDNKLTTKEMNQTYPTTRVYEIITLEKEKKMTLKNEAGKVLTYTYM